jgi:hypothetical protein
MMKERRREKREENKKENKFEEGGEGRWTDRIRLSTIQHIIVQHSIVQHIIAQHSTALSLHHSIQHCITEEGKAAAQCEHLGGRDYSFDARLDCLQPIRACTAGGLKRKWNMERERERER